MGRISINGMYKQCTDEYPELFDFLKENYPMFEWKKNEYKDNEWYSFDYKGFTSQVSLSKTLDETYKDGNKLPKGSILVRVYSTNSSNYYGSSQIYNEINVR